MTEQILAQTLEAVKNAGRIITDAWSGESCARHKGKIDLVTETDFAVQAFLRESLGRIRPEAGFIGEEDDGGQRCGGDLCWVVDPVDGTTNFVHRIPFVATSVALCEKGRPVLGVVNAPMTGECFYATRNGGAFLNGAPIAVSLAEEPVASVIATGFPYDVEPGLARILARLQNVLPATQGLRRLGAAAIDLAYVACGRMDGFYEEDLKPWDMAAGWLLVEEAGGRVTTMDGAPLALGKPLLATNGKIHQAMLELLAV